MNEEPKRGHFAKEKGEVVLREHEFDGIQEYDQKLPNWWLFTFYGAVVWFVVYWVIYYHGGVMRTDHDAVTERLAAIHETKLAELGKTLAELDDAKLVHQWAASADLVAAGEATYLTNCSACHAADLSGAMDVGGTKIALPGLPLDDGEWKFGGRPMDIFRIINEGSPPESEGHNGAKMQPWGQMLSPKQVAELTAYIISKVPQDFQSVPAQP